MAASILVLKVVTASTALWAAAPSVAHTSPTLDLKLDDYLRLVVARNESMQAQILELEVGHYKASGEWGIFEPVATASLQRQANKRINDVQQQASQSGQAYFTERNSVYNSGLESLIPTGAKIQLGYTLSDLVNNVNPSPFASLSSSNQILTKQYQSFAGVSFTQPLLKNAGYDMTMANIRLAAMESGIAYQQYRRQFMLTISQAQAAYWNLYFAQEQLKFFKESVGLAQSILSDSRERLQAGQASELDVLEAQSGLALRETKQNEARQNYYDAIAQLQALSGLPPLEQGRMIRAIDTPSLDEADLSYTESFRQAFDSNPDFLIQRGKVDEGKLRLRVARNQLLPELNAKGSYGYNGLGSTPGRSMDMLQTQNFPSWSLGVELRIPLAGGIKGHDDFYAAKLTVQESIASLNGMQTQIANVLDATIRKIRGWQESIRSYQTVVDFNNKLLSTQVARLNAGKVEPRKVFEVEADLFESRQSLAQALVQRQRTLLELQLAEGTVLKHRQLELTREELRHKTRDLLSSHAISLDAFAPIVNQPSSITP